MKKPLFFLLTGIALLSLAACSTKKNTSGSRFWHSFTARYNTYYNGEVAFREGLLAQEQGHKDNYTEQLPLFPVSAENSRSLGKSNFETAITKCEKAIQLHSIKRRPEVSATARRSAKMKAYLSRKEFNPFLKNAWLLMGQAQFFKGDFIEAASTFSYITRHYAAEPPVAAEARIWLARCYAELEWFYDAEEALSKVPVDTLRSRPRREYETTMADLMLRQGREAEALPYLRRMARHEGRKQQRARLYYLIGQIESSAGNRREAYRAFTKCICQSPPYELAFNARILRTEALAEGRQSRKMMKRLQRMARSVNNKDYLDRVYYAIGNIYMAENDTVRAITAYEHGRQKSTRSGVEKGILLLRLGEVYWAQGRYDRAQTCYAEAVGLIDKTHEGYAEITRRSQVLDQLVPHTSAVYLQDSLLALSVMPEAERNAAIDRVIEELKRQEKEAERARADSLAETQHQAGSGTSGQATPTPPTSQGGDQSWYFYNPMLVSQGKEAFRRQWGTRKNEDNWRRSNRTVLAEIDNEEYDYAAEDSLDAMADSLAADTTAPDSAIQDSLTDDPHTREYYLKQIPFTDEAKAAAHLIIQDGLYQAGLIEKDELEDFALAARTLERLNREYPQFEKTDDVLYQLFLLYSRWKKTAEAEVYRQRLAAEFPNGEMTRVITHPDFERLGRFGREIEDSLYTQTYTAYRTRDNATVAANFARSTNEFPTGLNRPKFIFVHALSRLGTAPAKEVAEELRELVTRYPESDVSEMAGMLVKGLESGRTPGSGPYDIGSLWSRRSAESAAIADSLGRVKALSAERAVPFVCIIAYPTDSLNDGEVLYDLAHFNFTGFMVRNFELTQQRDRDITQMRIAGFNSFDEAHAYATQLYNSGTIRGLRRARIVLISEENLDLLATTYSFDQYADFYEKAFAPLKINPDLPLDLQDQPAEQHYEDEYTPEELDRLKGKDTPVDEEDEGEWYE